MAASKKAARTITVLVRYELKKDCPEKGLHAGDVVLYVENDKGVRYHSFLRRSKHHSCECPAGKNGKSCYHVELGKDMENARYAAARAAKIVPIRPIENVPLNGNKGFQLMKSAS